MAKTTDIATKTELVELTNPNAILDFATQLKQLIVDNNLYTDIRGKNYVNVEGWQIAGAFTGTFPVVERVEDLSTTTMYKYRAEVSLRDKDGQQVGYGVAICTNKEKGKERFDEFAVASMAQTRAVGKAYRMKIGWLLKMAGYETTPAEEMDTVVEGKVVNDAPKSYYSIRDIGIAKKQLEQATTIEELKAIYIKIGDIRTEPEVVEHKNQLKAALENADEGSDDE